MSHWWVIFIAAGLVSWEKTNALPAEVQPDDGRKALASNAVTQPTTHPRSCLEIKSKDANAPSGIYTLKTASFKTFEAFCEMGYGVGGYTFLSPAALAVLTDSEIQQIITDKTRVLMRLRRSGGTEPFGELQQLTTYQNNPLLVRLSSNTGYQNPINAATSYIGRPYLYLGFIPRSAANQKNVQGIRVNGAQITFKNCDANPNSYFALFPNFQERNPKPHRQGFDESTYSYIRSVIGSFKHPPSSRVMPGYYYMFLESHFGGCGHFGVTNEYSRDILGAAIGLR